MDYSIYREKVDLTLKPEVSRLSERYTKLSSERGDTRTHESAAINVYVDYVRMRSYLVDTSRDEIAATYHFADLDESVVSSEAMDEYMSSLRDIHSGE